MNFPPPGVGCDYGRAIALPASHPTPGAIKRAKPGGAPLIIRGKLFRQPEPALTAAQMSCLTPPVTVTSGNSAGGGFDLDDVHLTKKTPDAIIRPSEEALLEFSFNEPGAEKGLMDSSDDCEISL